MTEELKELAKINKEVFGGLDIEKILNEPLLTDGEQRGMASSANAFYKAYFKKVLHGLYCERLKTMGEEVSTQEELLFSRGVIHAYGEIEKWFAKQENITKSNL